MTTYDQDNAQEIADLLVGRRIVRAEMGAFDTGHYGQARGRLVLDDGTEVYVHPHEGGCSCGAGDYDLTHLAAVDNVITSVRLENNPSGDDCANDGDGTYRIFVVADAVEINAVQFNGSDRNGYYGTGYSLTVKLPDEAGTVGPLTQPQRR